MPAFTIPTCQTPHTLDAISGYVVRKTFFDGTPHEDVATFSRPDVYDKARIVANAVRSSGHNGYAVVDNTYRCGCRGQG